MQQICDRLDRNIHTHIVPCGHQAYPVISIRVWDSESQSEETLQSLTRWDAYKDIESIWESSTGQWILRTVLDGTSTGSVRICAITPQDLPDDLLPQVALQVIPLLPKGQYNYIWDGTELRRLDVANQTVQQAQQSIYRDCVIPDHVGREVIFVKPFEVEGYPLIDDQVGGHNINATAPYQHYSSADVKDKSYMYFENGRFYNVKVTKEILKRNLGNGEHKVGFLVFSRVEQERLDALPEAYHLVETRQQPENRFQDGVYKLQSVKRLRANRIRTRELDEETWKHLVSDSPVTVIVPKNVISIPGLMRPLHIQGSFEQKGLNIEQRVALGEERIRDHYANPAHHQTPSVILVGPIGKGKTTITHLALSMQMGCVRDTRVGVFIAPQNGQVLDGIDLQPNGTFKSTELLSLFNDPGQLNIIDFPGFGDEGGAAYDIVNARILNTLLHAAGNNGNTKIAIVVTQEELTIRRGAFLRLLNELANLAPSDNFSTIKDALILVVNKYDEENVVIHDVLTDILVEQEDPNYQQDERNVKLTSQAKALLKFLRDHTEPTAAPGVVPRVMGIPRAGLNTWDQRKNEIQQRLRRFLLQADGFIGAPRIRQNIVTDPNAVRAYATENADRLNARAIAYLETEGVRLITHKMKSDIKAHVGDLASLRTLISERLAAIQVLRQPSTAHNDFVAKLKALIGEPGAIEALEITLEMDELKLMNAAVDYKLADWKQALGDAEQALIELAKPVVDTHDEATKVLRIEGILVSIADVQTLLKVHATKDVKQIDVFAANSVFVDGNFECNKGISLKIVAPKLKVIDTGSATIKRQINLSGANGEEHTPLKATNGDKPGDSGTHGLPGNPGTCGGHFLGYFEEIIGKDYLEIITNGGNGSAGQAGGDATLPRTRSDGDLSAVVRRDSELKKSEQTIREEIYNQRYYHEDFPDPGYIDTPKHASVLSGKEVYFESRGEDGVAGGNGGNGGKKGKGAAAGTNIIIENGYEIKPGPNSWTQIHENGVDGNDGAAGKAAAGETHGKIARGTWRCSQVSKYHHIWHSGLFHVNRNEIEVQNSLPDNWVGGHPSLVSRGNAADGRGGTAGINGASAAPKDIDPIDTLNQL